ncbi:hypothetical protein ACFC08_10750 [Streptomyces sp. NPDC056112]|uniref:hypothetical protein n=1 Tax=Streptomyces sp. NPDC056112 TaxID=3345715 RepID=UPI0035DFBFB2
MLVPGECPQQGAAAAGRRSRQPPPRGGRRQAVTSRLDTDQVFARRDHYVADWDDSGQAEWFKPIGADLFRGRGRIDGPRQVTVTRDDGAWQTLTVRHAVAVATGSRPRPDPRTCRRLGGHA